MRHLTDMPITEVIKKRKSSRTYIDKPMESQKKQISEFISGLGKPPFGSTPGFRIVELDLNITGKVSGTYGVIKGAETFIACVAENGPGVMEDVGYLFEQIILFATGIGLDTCWMGASFSRPLFSGKINLNPGETIPVVSPIGYKAGRRSLMDVIFQMSAGSKNRKPWPDIFFNRTFNEPLDINDAGMLKVPLEMVRLAPSAVNKQPWRLLLTEESVHFFLSRTKGFKSRFKMDLQCIDMGIAMCHFELAANEAGIAGIWKNEKPDFPLKANDLEYIVSWQFS